MKWLPTILLILFLIGVVLCALLVQLGSLRWEIYAG